MLKLNLQLRKVVAIDEVAEVVRDAVGFAADDFAEVIADEDIGRGDLPGVLTNKLHARMTVALTALEMPTVRAGKTTLWPERRSRPP